MKQSWLWACVAVLSLGLSGCALSPQQLNPTPKITTQIMPVGNGQPIAVRVVDGRSSPALGTRGGLYADTSTISVPSNTLQPKLQAEVEAGVRLLGFTPNVNAYNAPQMTVTLTRLSYQSPKEGLYVTEATIGAELRVDVRNGGRSHSSRYSATLNQGFGMAPNEETNTRLVSDVLTDALNRAFSDPAIGQILR